eukprot:c43885_g1_i1 orf=3-284(-)
MANILLCQHDISLGAFWKCFVIPKGHIRSHMMYLPCWLSWLQPSSPATSCTHIANTDISCSIHFIQLSCMFKYLSSKTHITQFPTNTQQSMPQC